MLAEKASMEKFFLKVLVWGESGGGKTRWALNSPKPLVIDTENSTLLYSNEFDFYRATVNESIKETKDYTTLTYNIVKEILDGTYKEIVNTLVIDSISDLLDNLETLLVNQYQKILGKEIVTLNATQKTRWYSFRRDKTRELLNKIINLPANVIFTARSKIKWDNVGGQLIPNGVIADCLEIVEFLMDCVIHIDKDGIIEITKSRLTKEKGIVDGIDTFNSFIELVKNKRVL